MDFFEALQKRRSIRQYTQEAVPDDVIELALDSALLAPNSSNLQPWEFYWVKSPETKQSLIEACLSQSAARTAQGLVVAVARIDTWDRNREILLEQISKGQGEVPKYLNDYYRKMIPIMYWQDPFGLVGCLKWVIANVAGIFRPVPRRPALRSDLFNVVTKTTALACENFMLAISALGFDSCPMEGFDESRVKKLLGLGRNSQVVMVISVGKRDPKVPLLPQYRLDKNLVIKTV